MIFNSQGGAELKTFINGGTFTPGDELILPKGGQLLGDLTIEAVDREAIYQEGHAAGYEEGYNTGFDAGAAAFKPYATELEYIRSDGAQWIDTGVKPNQDTRIIVDHYIESGGNLPTVFGAWDSAIKNSFIYLVYNTLASCSVFYNTTQTNATVTASGRHTIDANKNVFYLDGSAIVSAIYASFSCSYNLYLFKYNAAGTASNTMVGRIYSCQIYDNGTLVRDYIPVLDFSGVACLYDKVGKQLYYNQGSGEFVYELAA